MISVTNTSIQCLSCLNLDFYRPKKPKVSPTSLLHHLMIPSKPSYFSLMLKKTQTVTV